MKGLEHFVNINKMIEKAPVLPTPGQSQKTTQTGWPV
uniref:Uncharacterized protein n=1 Tax=Myoviridae sp. ct2Qy24 TaxID=2827656 RepID=A0A8S5SSA4_9CAUD|nr:MAG TPA: hypothetical protein [Myoviridae sp. ct2Qy24]